MVIDIKVDRNGETRWDGNGDLQTINGVDQIAQSIYISIITEVDLKLTSFTPENIEDLRSRIFEVVNNNPQTDRPIDVFASVRESEDNNQFVQFDVVTNSTKLTVTSE